MKVLLPVLHIFAVMRHYKGSRKPKCTEVELDTLTSGPSWWCYFDGRNLKCHDENLGCISSQKGGQFRSELKICLCLLTRTHGK
jgi:hypothetical protein